MNNKGKTSGMTAAMLIIAVAVLGLVAYMAFGQTGQTVFSQNQGGANTEGVYISTSSTAITLSGVDNAAPGTAVSGTTSISINGNPFITDDFTPSASPGNTLNILLINNTAYHNAYITGYKVPAAPTDSVSAKFNKNGTITLKLFNTNDQLQDRGATNQTVAAGGSYNMKLRMEGTDDVNTQDMVCLFEITAGANVTKITLDGKDGSVTKPNWYTLSGVGSSVYAFEVAPLVEAQTRDHFVNVQSATAKTIAVADLITTCVTKEYFLDSTTGKVIYSEQDSLGNLKSMAKYTLTRSFNA